MPINLLDSSGCNSYTEEEGRTNCGAPWGDLVEGAISWFVTRSLAANWNQWQKEASEARRPNSRDCRKMGEHRTQNTDDRLVAEILALCLCSEVCVLCSHLFIDRP